MWSFSEARITLYFSFFHIKASDISWSPFTDLNFLRVILIKLEGLNALVYYNVSIKYALTWMTTCWIFVIFSGVVSKVVRTIFSFFYVIRRSIFLEIFCCNKNVLLVFSHLVISSTRVSKLLLKLHMNSFKFFSSCGFNPTKILLSSRIFRNVTKLCQVLAW